MPSPQVGSTWSGVAERGALRAVALTWQPLGTDHPLLDDVNIEIGAGQRVLLAGVSGAGKSTLLKLLAGAFNPEYSDGLTPDTGTIKWAEKASVGYYPQDHENDFDVDMNLSEWMRQWGQEGDDEQVIRGTLGRLLFGSNDVVKNVRVLSGGEKALTAMSLVFALFSLNPAPFCLLDEVDAPLDDANTSRFCNLVKEMSAQTQFLYISHNRLTMEMAEQLVGVTMQEKGVSRVVAVDIKQALEKL